MTDAPPPHEPLDPTTPDQEPLMTDVHTDTSEQAPLDAPATETGRRRPLDITSLVAGVVVLAITAAFAFGEPDSLHDQGRVVGPLVLLGIGVALLVGSIRR